MGQLFALHAGKTNDSTAWEMAQAFGIEIPRHEIVHGAIVAICRLVDVVDAGPGRPFPSFANHQRWAFGPYCWVVDEMVRFDPIPCPGHQGLWTVPKAAHEIVEERWNRARSA
jgi:hypothetical protein